MPIEELYTYSHLDFEIFLDEFAEYVESEYPPEEELDFD